MYDPTSHVPSGGGGGEISSGGDGGGEHLKFVHPKHAARASTPKPSTFHPSLPHAVPPVCPALIHHAGRKRFISSPS